jgi:hypothetical protein
MKVCYTCKILKPLIEYTKKPINKDGLNSNCKCCISIRAKKVKEDKLSANYVDKSSLAFRSKSFKLISEDLHIGKYGYQKVDYLNAHTKVEILCNKHNLYFWQTPNDHTSGKGCQFCANETISEKLSSTTESWTTLAVATQGKKYDYSEVVYAGDSVKVKITCNSCKTSFMQQAGNHLSGNGCPKCAKYGYDSSLTANLYVMSCGNMIKVGITNREPSARAAQIAKSGNKFNVVFFVQSDGIRIRKAESILKDFLKEKYRNPENKFDGYTETFLDVCINMLQNKVEEVLHSLK